MNVAAAACIGRYFDVPVNMIEDAVQNYMPDMNRSHVVQQGSNTIYLDAYNANPDSMRAALQTFAKVPAMNKVVILGDMLELGEEEIREHKDLGKMVQDMGGNVTSIFCGPL